MKNRNKRLEVLFWSIAFPGFGQLLNRHIIKGLALIFLEFLVNIQSNFNQAILYSFLGDIDQAFSTIDYQWLMFYPCVYFFAMWDSYKFAGDEPPPFSFLPFVFSAYFVTFALMISRKIEIFGLNIGPVFLPMLFVIFGLAVGQIIRKLIIFFTKEGVN